MNPEKCLYNSALSTQLSCLAGLSLRMCHRIYSLISILIKVIEIDGFTLCDKNLINCNLELVYGRVLCKLWAVDPDCPLCCRVHHQPCYSSSLPEKLTEVKKIWTFPFPPPLIPMLRIHLFLIRTRNISCKDFLNKQKISSFLVIFMLKLHELSRDKEGFYKSVQIWDFKAK